MSKVNFSLSSALLPHSLCYISQGVMSAEEEASPKPVDHGSPSFLEKLGAGTDALLENFFEWWGTGELEGICCFVHNKM
jgi:hypothetical protein